MHRQRLRYFLIWASLASVGIVAGGCGGSSSPTTPTTTTTPQPSITNFTYNVPSGNHWYQNITTLRAGKMTITLRWNDAGKDLDLYLTTRDCNYWEERCAGSILGRSEAETGNQEQVVLNSVAKDAAYTFWILNYGASTEEARVEVKIE